MLKKSLAFFSVLLFSWGLYAGSVGKSALQKITKKYRASKVVEMTVEKSVKSELLGRETKYDGKIYIGNDKFRWENDTPEKTLLVYDGDTIWSEQSPPPEFGGAVQVARGKVNKKTKSHILISSLLGDDLEKNFKIVKETKQADGVLLEVVPRQDDLTVKTLNVLIDTKANLLKQISYHDDIGNLTMMSFSDVKFLNKEKKNLFKYQPPKGAQVTEL